jgi:hypothetical protein
MKREVQLNGSYLHIPGFYLETLKAILMFNVIVMAVASKLGLIYHQKCISTGA